MITTDQMDEWIKEVEERPSSGPIIVRFIANRLRDLTHRNEELLAENIELRSGKKVEEYESRIATLEYQVELLKRQVGGDLSTLDNLPVGSKPAAAEYLCMLVYTPKGQVLRVDLPAGKLAAGFLPAQIAAAVEPTTRLLVIPAHEELLFVYDSGRVAAVAAGEVPAEKPGKLDWRQAYLMEPRAGEQLAIIAPIARMALADFIIQASRRGCVKKMMKTSFETALGKNYIGTGINVKTDQTFTLALSGKEDRFVMASREGYLISVDVSRMSFTAEETFRIGATDYLVSGFIAGTKPSLLVMTQHGKSIHREIGWLETAATSKTRGQPIFSQSRRETGVRVAGAAAVDENDWAAALHQDGRLSLHPVADLFARGSIADEDREVSLVDFVTFTPPVSG